MSCGCKANKNLELPIKEENINKKENPIKIIVNYTIKLIGFFIGLLLLPIIMIVIIYQMFKTIVLNKNVDLKPLFSTLVKFMEKANNTEEEEESYDIDDIDDIDDLTMVDYEDITEKNK